MVEILLTRLVIFRGKPESLLECPERRLVVVDELIEVICGVVRWKLRSVSADYWSFF